MPEFARGAEKRILDSFFGRAEGVTNGPELQALIVLHLKYNAFTRRQTLHRRRDVSLDFLSNEGAFGVQRGAPLTLALEKIGQALFVEAGIQFGRLVFGARLAAVQVVHANVSVDAV